MYSKLSTICANHGLTITTNSISIRHYWIYSWFWKKIGKPITLDGFL